MEGEGGRDIRYRCRLCRNNVMVGVRVRKLIKQRRRLISWDGEVHGSSMEISLEWLLLLVRLEFLQMTEKEQVSVMSMALCGHVYVNFQEEACVNADLFHCGIGSDLCMRPCSISLKIMHL